MNNFKNQFFKLSNNLSNPTRNQEHKVDITIFFFIPDHTISLSGINEMSNIENNIPVKKL